MNKSRKIWLNYLIGAVISAILLWSIYIQVKAQLKLVDTGSWVQSGFNVFIVLGLALMPLNLAIESYKWKLLASSAQPISVWQSLKSLLAGLAFSVITPNRIGEYPGRVLYLKRDNTIRLISVSVLGIFSQFLTLFIFGIIGLVYYNLHSPGYWQKLVLISAVVILVFICLIFFFFEYWAKYFEHLSWFRRYNAYGYLLKRFSIREQLVVLALSMLRFLVFTAQYLILMRWMNIQLSPAEGFCTAFLFFWGIAVIPSIALAELGIRGKLSLFLFGAYSSDVMGILAATFGLWCINLIIPAVAGSILLIRMKLWR